MIPRLFMRGPMAIAALAAALVIGAGSARAQLPPSPSDAPVTDRSAVRPTLAPRTPPPPPPDRLRPIPRSKDAPGSTAPPAPPPPEAAPPPAPSASAAPAPSADKIFATRGVFELGGSFDFSVQRDTVNQATWLNLGLDAYLGAFVAKYIALGMYLSVRYSSFTSGEYSSWSISPGILLAPGVAVRLMRRVFFYGDLLGGLYGRKAQTSDYSSNRVADIFGTLGGEVGVKLRLTGHVLLRLGVRCTYDLGKADSELATGHIKSDIGRFSFLIRIGLGGFL